MNNIQQVRDCINQAGFQIDASNESIRSVREGVNRSYRVQASNQALFVKLGTEAGQRIYSEYEVYKILDKTANVPVPEPLAHGEIDGIPYLITKWMSDTNIKYDLDDSASTSISRSLGKILGIIHRDVSAGYGTVGIKDTVSRTWRDFFRKWLIHNAEDVKSKYGGLGSSIMECVYNADIPDPERYSLCPMDYHSGNALFRDDEIVSIVDFERTYGGDPMWSFSVSNRLVGLNGDSEAFRDGYQSIVHVENSPIYEVASLCRELRIAHMIFDSVEDRADAYRDEIDRLQDKIYS